MKPSTLLLCSGALLPLALSGANKELPPPNILWLTFEDTSPQFIGCYGNEWAKTPVIDSLAAEGVQFMSAFSTATVSSPSRFSLITGCRPTRFATGHHRSGYEIPTFVQGFPTFLRQAGYYTTNNVKTDYNHKQHREMATLSWDENSQKATWKNRASGQPFFAVFNSNHSHQSRTMTNPWNLYEKQILSSLDSSRITATDANFEIPACYRNSSDMRKQLSRVYNAISRTDQHFGEILAQLQADGLAENTIIFCFADHGEGIPRGKGSALGLGYRVPFILYVPEQYRHLSPFKMGSTTTQPVSFEDMAATMLSIAGIEQPSYMEGVPFAGTRQEKKSLVYGGCDALDINMELSRSVTDGHYLYTRVFTHFQPFVRWMSYYDYSVIQQLMRQDLASGTLAPQQAEILQPRTAEYLYDIKNDKWEINNLAYNPKYKKVKEKLRAALTSHLIESKDAHFIPEYTLVAHQSHTIPYYLRTNAALYPVQEVIETAMLSTDTDKNLPTILEKIESPHAVVTFWAAMALLAETDLTSQTLAALQTALPTLAYAPTKVLVAATILNHKEDAAARAALQAALHSSEVYEAVYALQMLQTMPLERAKTFVPDVQQLAQQYKGVKKAENILGAIEVARLRLENVPIHFEHFW